MLTAAICKERYGDPNKPSNMGAFDMPEMLRAANKALPKRVWCNLDLMPALRQALFNLHERNLLHELKTWDGCFCVRPVRGGKEMSIHSWAMAVDVNAVENVLGKEPKLSAEFVKCFTDAGFDWGGNWKRKDGMHFQPSVKYLEALDRDTL